MWATPEHSRTGLFKFLAIYLYHGNIIVLCMRKAPQECYPKADYFKLKVHNVENSALILD